MRKWLKDARLAKGMTQAHLANKLNIDITTVGKYELGERRPSPEIAQAIAAVLGFDWTLFYQDNAHKGILPGKETPDNDQRLRHSI